MRNKCGVYSIINIDTGDFYIGSTNNLTSRKNYHLSYLRRSAHKNKRLQNAYAKYGADSFLFHVIEHCDERDLINIEQAYIDLLSPTYNISPIAGERFRAGQKLTEAQKRHLSKLKTGRKLSDETKQILRTINLGKTHTDKTKNTLSEKGKIAWRDPAYRAAISKCRKSMWGNADWRKLQAEKIKAALNNTNVKALISEQTKKRWQNNEFKRRVSDSIRNSLASKKDILSKRRHRSKNRYSITNIHTGRTYELIGAQTVCKKLKIGPCTVSRACNGQIIRNKYKIERCYA